MKRTAIPLCLFALGCATRAVNARPQSADFIAPEARIYFDSARGSQFWGMESSGWRLAMVPLGDEKVYVEEPVTLTNRSPGSVLTHRYEWVF